MRNTLMWGIGIAAGIAACIAGALSIVALATWPLFLFGSR